MIQFVQFLYVCIKAYRVSNGRIGYVAVTTHGVPQVTVLVAMGREAWRLSHLAIEAIEARPQ